MRPQSKPTPAKPRPQAKPEKPEAKPTRPDNKRDMKEVATDASPTRR